MKLTQVISAALAGIQKNDIRVNYWEQEATKAGDALRAARAEAEAHREMVKAMLKLQDLMPENETLEFRP